MQDDSIDASGCQDECWNAGMLECWKKDQIDDWGGEKNSLRISASF